MHFFSEKNNFFEVLGMDRRALYILGITLPLNYTTFPALERDSKLWLEEHIVIINDGKR